jgi:aspartate carbamoyltransferase catalytic subunit
MRHRDNQAPHEVAEIVDCPVINAGDGTNEHPTQALLDALTLRQQFGTLEGRTVAIVGDIRHSRVARSNAKLLSRLGATVRLAGPPELMPDDLPGGGDIEQAIAGADAVMMLRVQRERMDAEFGDAPGEFLARYGLTEERLALAAPDAVVLHPGPMNRGVEIADSVADGPRSLIRRQVANGVAVRMAVLEMLLKA